LDGIERETRIRFDPMPESFDEHGARYHLRLGRGERCNLFLTIGFDAEPLRPRYYFAQLRLARRVRRTMVSLTPEIDSSSSGFNEVVARAKADVAMLVTDTEQGPYPYAGIPWFSAPFGRDGIITALETLW